MIIMNDEIKEILDDLLFTTTLPNVSIKLNKEKLNQLKDYITNLQQELENKCWDEASIRADLLLEQEDYKSRCEKANEFINENTELEHDGDDYGYMEWINIINMDTMTFINKLSDILNGEE